MKAYPDLSWPVVQRVETLEKILKWLPKEDPEDEWQQLENLKALMKAYKDKSLDWTPGLVTYWSKGFKLCEPRPWEDEEFMHINVKHKGHTGFWVEGVWRSCSACHKHANKECLTAEPCPRT
jgi:hypothetical protein